MSVPPEYQSVIGLEIHIRLLTGTKVFSGESAAYHNPPNTGVHPVSLAYPGVLPLLNPAVITHAIKLGLACQCKIHKYSEFARKNYFYPDMPKGYQITQHQHPVCGEGIFCFNDSNGLQQAVRIQRIHIEEDSGKSVHAKDEFNSWIDYNRAGIPLLELITFPEINDANKASEMLAALRRLVRYLAISNGNMEEGSLRCDANISVKKKTDCRLGTKVEVKNMNSITNVRDAIAYEIKRQTTLLQNNQSIKQQTRAFDAVKNITIPMRDKEESSDYRYLPEPDIPPLIITQKQIHKINKELPELPVDLFNKLTIDFGLPQKTAANIIEEKADAECFFSIMQHTTNAQQAANWILGSIRLFCKQQAVSTEKIPIPPKAIAELINMVDDGLVSNTIATSKIFPAMLKQPEKAPDSIAKELGLQQISNNTEIEEIVQQIIAKFPNEANTYRNGKKALFGFFMGQIMKQSGGKVNPETASKVLKQTLEE